MADDLLPSNGGGNGDMKVNGGLANVFIPGASDLVKTVFNLGAGAVLSFVAVLLIYQLSARTDRQSAAALDMLTQHAEETKAIRALIETGNATARQVLSTQQALCVNDAISNAAKLDPNTAIRRCLGIIPPADKER
jgi:hypothetical protein